jgi:hypothetical protein
MVVQLVERGDDAARSIDTRDRGDDTVVMLLGNDVSHISAGLAAGLRRAS